MTRLGLKGFHLVVLTWLVAAGVAVQAQQFKPTYPPAFPDPGAGDGYPYSQEAGPAIPPSPETPPAWTQERTTTNRAGTVLNRHGQTASEDGSQYLREHTVTNPSGEMVQTWERSEGEEGYLYRRAHGFAGPDGTPLRQQEWEVTGTDPYNYTRQHQTTLRDGRTISQSQTRQSQHAWAPDGQVPVGPAPVLPGLEPMEPATTGAVASDGGVGAVSPDPEGPKKKTKLGWLGKLNPFRKGGLFRRSEPSPQRPSGFTVGSAGQRSTGHLPYGLSKKQPGQPSPNSHRPSWAGPFQASPTAAQPRSPQGRNR